MKKLKILVVEDDAIVRMDLELYLRTLGFEISASCSSGEDAVESVAHSKPDLVLMDIILKGEMDGVDAARQIRSGYRIPLIYLSGYFDDVAVARAKLTEPAGYLLKPYDKRTLRITIERVLDRTRASGERTTQTAIRYRSNESKDEKSKSE
jgi:CheY-like chemotaxis protein